MDAVTAAEKACYQSSTTIVGATGYAAGSDVPVASKVYSIAGTGSYGSGGLAPGESAALVRYSTAAKTTKNHPIYLFNYYHGASNQNSGPTVIDLLVVNYKNALSTYATNWISGFSDGSITAVRASPNGAAATGEVVEEYLTHRDFPYTRSL
jgi:hypothetical protein